MLTHWSSLKGIQPQLVLPVTYFLSPAVHPASTELEWGSVLVMSWSEPLGSALGHTLLLLLIAFLWSQSLPRSADDASHGGVWFACWQVFPEGHPPGVLMDGLCSILDWGSDSPILALPLVDPGTVSMLSCGWNLLCLEFSCVQIRATYLFLYLTDYSSEVSHEWADRTCWPGWPPLTLIVVLCGIPKYLELCLPALLPSCNFTASVLVTFPYTHVVKRTSQCSRWWSSWDGSLAQWLPMNKRWLLAMLPLNLDQ